MPLIDYSKCENDGIVEAYKLMAISARTAPKTKGIDNLDILIVNGAEKEALATEMEKISVERKISGFKRDGKNVRDSLAVFLIGLESDQTAELNCGACGFNTCNDFKKIKKIIGSDFTGPFCIFKILDLGIALGSAVKTASLLNIDNRIMYRIGVAAKRLKLMEGSDIIIGIPLSAKGKNIFFDRK